MNPQSFAEYYEELQALYQKHGELFPQQAEWQDAHKRGELAAFSFYRRFPQYAKPLVKYHGIETSVGFISHRYNPILKIRCPVRLHIDPVTKRVVLDVDSLPSPEKQGDKYVYALPGGGRWVP